MTTTEMAQPTFLLVDDDDYSLDLAHFTLGRLGFTQVQTARDGKEGLRAFDEMTQPPDCLICDIFMPNGDGIEFMAELAKRGYRGGIVLVSSSDRKILSIARQLAVANGLNVLGALTKPLQHDEWQQVLFGRVWHPLATLS